MKTAQNISDNAAKLSQVVMNAAQFPEQFYCRHMFPGLAGYESEDILIDVDAMKNMLPSMKNKPVYVEHQDVDLENLQAEADGYVVDCFYNPNDGWAWAKFIVVSDAGLAAVRSGWSVSNAYMPTEWGAGGKVHNVDYDRKIVNAQFTHLALVPNPRYENAKIYTPEEFKAYQEEKQNELRNSKSGAEPMFKLFNKKTEEVKNATDITAETTLTLKDEAGVEKQVSIGEMLNAVKKNDEDEKKKKDEAECMNKKAKKNGDEDEDMFNADDEVNIGDIKMPLGVLVNKFNAIQKKNADEAAEKEKKEKENAEAEDKKEKDEEKKNSKHFDELKNATEKSVEVTNSIEIPQDKLARGINRYGSAALNKTKA